MPNPGLPPFIRLIAAALLLGAPPVVAAALTGAQTVGSTTRAFVRIPDVARFESQWQKSSLGQLMADQAMQAFLNQASSSFQSQLLQLKRRTGLDWDDWSSVARGELCLALIEFGDAEIARAIVVQVGDQSREASALVERARTALVRRGAVEAVKQVHGITLYTLAGHQPEDEDSPSALFALHKGLLLFCDHPTEAEKMLARMSGRADDTLASTEGYQECLAQTDTLRMASPAHLQFFIDPFGLGRLLEDPETTIRDPAEDPIDKHGLRIVRGLGGKVWFGQAPHDVLYSLAISAPRPHTRALAMLDLQPLPDRAPLAWAPDRLSNFLAISWNLNSLFDHLGPVFDDFVADGIEGTYDDILRDLKSARGPGVDLLGEIIPLLGPRVYGLSGMSTPISAHSEYTIWAIETKDEQRTADALERLLGDDPGVQRLRQDGFPHAMWVIGQDKRIEEKKLHYNSSAMMVVRGHLLIASRSHALPKLLQQVRSAGKLSQHADFQLVWKQLDALGAEGAVARTFTRLDQELHTTYELLRRGQIHESESIYARLLRTILPESHDGRPALDYSVLPEFDKIRQHLGLSALYVKNVPMGWSIVGFSLPTSATSGTP